MRLPKSNTFPKIIALDTDWTIWQGFLDPNVWAKGRGPYSPVEDNIECIDRGLLRDRTNHDNWIRVYSDVARIVNDILKNRAKLAIVSRNPSKAMCDRALYHFSAINPDDGHEQSIIHLVKYDEVADQSKVEHFRRIRTWSTTDFSDMILFDDESVNNAVTVELGISFQLLNNKNGLTWDAYQQGLNAWRRAKDITITRNPSSVPRRMLVGYSGLPNFWVDLVCKGEGLIDPSLPARWGYALYVAPSVQIAKFFAEWNGNYTADKSHLCGVWVKDYDAWMKINKIWVPEHSSTIPQMNNMNWPNEMSAANQEYRDYICAQRWGVQTPYVLFSMHHWMPGMPAPLKQRWAEMVVYTQIQRSLFEVIPLSDAQISQIKNPCPYPFHCQFKQWGIVATDEARKEFLRYKEFEAYQLSE